MNVASQPWSQEKDHKRLVQGLEPPPPPGDGDAWELHFCKWWGWNWVRKREVGMSNRSSGEPMPKNKSQSPEKPMSKTAAPRQTSPPPNNKKNKPEKKPVKELYNTLCFKKKKPKDEETQKMYNTPSDSIMDDKNDQKPIQTLQNLYDTPSNSIRNRDPVEEAVEKEIIRTDLEAPKKRSRHEKKKPRKEWSTTSSDECGCMCKTGSTSDGSVEYINIKCCPCCHSKETPHPPTEKKQTVENCTQFSAPCKGMMATQTEPKADKERKHRKKRICLVCCCHCCGQGKQSTCPCKGNDKEPEKEIQKPRKNYKAEAAPPAKSEDGVRCPCTCCNHDKQTGQAEKKTNRSRNYEVSKEPKPVDDRLLSKSDSSEMERDFRTCPRRHGRNTKQVYYSEVPRYVSGLPMDAMFYPSKPITKFGIPSHNYSWIHATKSDIWDQFSNIRHSHHFSSPVSGKRYNISPIIVGDVGAETSFLLDPLSVDEELDNLREIKNSLEMDLKSRVMLDAVCDAILSKDKDISTSTSIFMNEFTYPSAVKETTEAEPILNDLYQQKEKSYLSKTNQTSFHDIHFDNEYKKTCKNKNVCCQPDTHNFMDSELRFGKLETTVEVYPNVRSPQIYSAGKQHTRVIDDSSFLLNYSTTQPRPQKNESTRQLIDYTFKNGSLMPFETPSFTRTGLMSAYKRRSASPTTRNHGNKKPKLKESSTITNVDNMNIRDIFRKIDEIVLRSKVNNEEIQNVLNTIPKRTFQFFTSWEVSRSNPMLRITEEGKASSSTMSEPLTIEKRDTKLKPLPATKRKTNRPSLIPKRITQAKPNVKKNE